MSTETMTSWRLKRPDDTRIRAGQSDLPEGLRYGNQELPWGTVVEVRAKCEFPFEFDEAEQKYLIHIDYLQPRRSMFESLNN